AGRATCSATRPPPSPAEGRAVREWILVGAASRAAPPAPGAARLAAPTRIGACTRAGRAREAPFPHGPPPRIVTFSVPRTVLPLGTGRTDASYEERQETPPAEREAAPAQPRHQEGHEEAGQDLPRGRQERHPRASAGGAQHHRQEARQGGGQARDPPQPG